MIHQAFEEYMYICSSLNYHCILYVYISQLIFICILQNVSNLLYCYKDLIDTSNENFILLLAIGITTSAPNFTFSSVWQ